MPLDAPFAKKTEQEIKNLSQKMADMQKGIDKKNNQVNKNELRLLLKNIDSKIKNLSITVSKIEEKINRTGLKQEENNGKLTVLIQSIEEAKNEMEEKIRLSTENSTKTIMIKIYGSVIAVIVALTMSIVAAYAAIKLK